MSEWSELYYRQAVVWTLLKTTDDPLCFFKWVNTASVCTFGKSINVEGLCWMRGWKSSHVWARVWLPRIPRPISGEELLQRAFPFRVYGSEGSVEGKVWRGVAGSGSRTAFLFSAQSQLNYPFTCVLWGCSCINAKVKHTFGFSFIHSLCGSRGADTTPPVGG